MMNVMLKLLFTGLCCFRLCEAQTGLCEAYVRCATNAGYAVSNIGQSTSVDDIVNGLCENQDLINRCYQSMTECDFYKNALKYMSSSEESSKGLTVLCNHRQVYIDATKCAVQASQRLTASFLQNCLPQFDKFQELSLSTSSEFCSAITNLMSCDSEFEKIFRCEAPLITTLVENGMHVPCYSVYEALSSSTKVQPSNLLYCVFIAVVTAVFL